MNNDKRNINEQFIFKGNSSFRNTYYSIQEGQSNSTQKSTNATPTTTTTTVVTSLSPKSLLPPLSSTSSINNNDKNEETELYFDNIYRKLVTSCMVGNCFCCDRCAWSPVNPRLYSIQTATIPAKRSIGYNLKKSLLFYLTVIHLIVQEILLVWLHGNYLTLAIHSAVIIVSLVLFTIMMALLFTTVCTDPGILLPATEEQASPLEQRLSKCAINIDQ